MKYSMKRQFAFIFITLITGTILMCLILNSTLLGTYYLNKKQNAPVSYTHLTLPTIRLG